MPKASTPAAALATVRVPPTGPAPLVASTVVVTAAAERTACTDALTTSPYTTNPASGEARERQLAVAGAVRRAARQDNRQSQQG